MASRRLSQVILSTDDEEIAEIGRRCGVDVPFLRPGELAQDDTPMLPVVQHAVNLLEKRGQSVDAVCLLQPTNPLRRHDDIDACIDLLELCDADAVVTVLPVPIEHHPYWVYLRNDAGLLRLSTGAESPTPRRQDLPPAFYREGSVYVTRRDVLMEDNSLYGKRLVGHLLDGENSVNIDVPADWERAERLIACHAS
jgi:CMP-N,N'-diacetyllegionaminic acid synthase